MLDYQQPEPNATLAQGLREYYESHAEFASGRGLSDTAREFFRCHDAAHVVFGCTTALLDEAIVKMWSFFGTTAGLGLMRAYRLPESQEIYETIAWRDVAATAARAPGVVPIVLWRCTRMRKRWPWSEFSVYLDVPLTEIRSEFGIRVLLH
jgi:hypothetical protein